MIVSAFNGWKIRNINGDYVVFNRHGDEWARFCYLSMAQTVMRREGSGCS